MQYETMKYLIHNLGNPISNESLAHEVENLGIGLGSLIGISEVDLYIERRKEGYSLIFTDEADFLGKSDQPIGVGSRYLTGIFLYAEGKDDYSQYKGDLPCGLSFHQTEKIVKELLGQPNWAREKDGRIVSEAWDQDCIRLHLTYSKEGSISLINISYRKNA